MTVSERFLKYVSFGTNSDECSESCPSTANQLVLGNYLAKELKLTRMDTYMACLKQHPVEKMILQ